MKYHKSLSLPTLVHVHLVCLTIQHFRSKIYKAAEAFQIFFVISGYLVLFALIPWQLYNNKLNIYLIPTVSMLYYKAMINDFSVVIRANKCVITSLQM